jgi:hypothetical protein
LLAHPPVYCPTHLGTGYNDWRTGVRLNDTFADFIAMTTLEVTYPDKLNDLPVKFYSKFTRPSHCISQGKASN